MPRSSGASVTESASPEQVGLAAMTRREELERARTAARGADLNRDAPATFLARMKRFLRLQ